MSALAGLALYEKWHDRRPARDDPDATAVVEIAPRGTPCPNGSQWHPSCKRRNCRVCGGSWSQNVYTVIRCSLEAFAAPITIVSITPPGQQRLPWDTEICRHSRSVKCSGELGCRVQERAVREWSETLTWRASKLRKAAYQALKRSGLNVNPQWLERVWEPQRRGPAHLHIVLPFGTFLEKRVAKAYVAELTRLAPNYDFGFVDRKLEVWNPKSAARYLAGYLTGRSAKKKPTMRANIADPNLPPSLFWVSPKLTNLTHVTMRSLRRARHLFACQRDPTVPQPAWSGPTEAVKAVAAYRRLFMRRKRAVADDDIRQALELAIPIDRKLRELRDHAPALEFYEQRDQIRDFAALLVAKLLPAPTLAVAA